MEQLDTGKKINSKILTKKFKKSWQDTQTVMEKEKENWGAWRGERLDTSTYHSSFTVLILSMSFILVLPLHTKRRWLKKKNTHKIDKVPSILAYFWNCNTLSSSACVDSKFTRKQNLPTPAPKSPDGSLFPPVSNLITMNQASLSGIWKEDSFS